jgi:uncharacterized RDD family membrane protein YckC
VLRDIVPIATFPLTLFALPDVLGGIDPLVRRFASDAASLSDEVTSWIFTFWNVAEIVTMLTNAKRRALHDLIAGSVVVRTESIGRRR